MSLSGISETSVDDIRAACEVVRGCHAAIDRGQAASALPMFTEDAHFEARGAVLKGQQQIGEFLRNRQAQTDRQTVHLITAELVEQVSATEVEMSAFVLLFLRGPKGDYTVDRVVDTRHVVHKTADGWRIARRYSHPLHPSPIHNIQEDS